MNVLSAESIQERRDLLREISGPHQGQPVLVGGTPLAEARSALILVHGRGASAADILSLAPPDAEGLAVLAPQAARHTWYPQRFTAPREANEPFLGSALEVLDALQQAIVEAGIQRERIFLAGFSQGACLTAEHVLRQEAPLGGAALFVGGYLGPEGTPAPGEKSLRGMPVLLAAGDPDPHVPWARVEETARALKSRGAAVEARRRPGMGHAIHPEDARLFWEMTSER